MKQKNPIVNVYNLKFENKLRDLVLGHSKLSSIVAFKVQISIYD